MENQQLAFRPEEIADRRLLPLGRTTVFKLIATGELESFKVGRARLVPADALAKFIAKRRADQAGASV